jgi:hypothetical protein
VYTEEELGVIRRIKELLYEEGYTIAGAKKRLQAELEDGRSFAAPEGELFTPEEGDDDVPEIAVDTAGGDDDTAEGDEAADADAASEVAAVTTAGVTTEPGAEAETEALPAAAPVEAAPIEVVRSEKASARRATGGRAGGSRRRGAAAERAAANEAVQAATEPTTGEVEAIGDGADAPAPASTAVDSALSERVETLEHGLRRVLAEVRQLRDLLGGSSADR